MKAVFNGEVYEMPQSFNNHIIINRILTEVEDLEHIPFYVQDSEGGVFFMFGRKVQYTEE